MPGCKATPHADWNSSHSSRDCHLRLTSFLSVHLPGGEFENVNPSTTHHLDHHHRRRRRHQVFSILPQPTSFRAIFRNDTQCCEVSPQCRIADRDWRMQLLLLPAFLPLSALCRPPQKAGLNVASRVTSASAPWLRLACGNQLSISRCSIQQIFRCIYM